MTGRNLFIDLVKIMFYATGVICLTTHTCAKVK